MFSNNFTHFNFDVFFKPIVESISILKESILKKISPFSIVKIVNLQNFFLRPLNVEI